MGALISVLMPYRDAAQTVCEASQDILRQIGVQTELIAIDDHSSDDGPARLIQLQRERRRYAARRSAQHRSAEERPAVIRMLKNPGRGVATALTHGLRAATGDWIARMDADDRCAPTRLREQLAAIVRAPRVAAMGCGVRAFPDSAVGEGLRRYVDWQNSLRTPTEHQRDRFVEATLCHPSVLLRREALEQVGAWRDEPWPEDYALWLRLHAAGWQLAKVTTCLFSWRHHPGRATFSHERYSRRRFLELRATFLAPLLLGHKISVWGAGKTGRHLARALEPHGVKVARFIDIDARKIGRRARGAPIVAGNHLQPRDGVIVVAVGARGARAQVRAELLGRGFVEGEHFICAA